MRIKSKLKFHLTSGRFGYHSGKTQQTGPCWGVEKSWHTASEKAKACSHCGNWCGHQKPHKTELPDGPARPFLGLHTKQIYIRALQRYLSTIFAIVLYGLPWSGIRLMSSNRWVDQENVADIHNEALFRQKEEQNDIMCRKMGGIGGHPSTRLRWTQEDKCDTYFLSCKI